MSNKIVLVAFFSHAGENNSVGNVKTGNAQVVAQMIADWPPTHHIVTRNGTEKSTTKP